MGLDKFIVTSICQDSITQIVSPKNPLYFLCSSLTHTFLNKMIEGKKTKRNTVKNVNLKKNQPQFEQSARQLLFYRLNISKI